MRGFAALVVACLLVIPAVAPAQELDQVVNAVEATYGKMADLQAEFTQVARNKSLGQDVKAEGTVYLKKGGKMRWDYLEVKGGVTTVKKSFISDGTTLYVVEHDNKQVTKKSLAQDLMPVAVTFLYGKGNLKAEFNPALETNSSYGAKGDLAAATAEIRPRRSIWLIWRSGAVAPSMA